MQRDQSGAARSRGQRVDGMRKIGRIAVGFDDEQRTGLGDGVPGMRTREPQRLVVHEFQCARHHRLRHQARDRGCCGDDIGVARGKRGPGRGLRRELERGLRDDGERAFRADQQPRQVVTNRALGGVDAAAQFFTGAGYRTQRERVLAATAVFHRARSGGVAGEVAADRAVRARGRIGRPEESVFGERGLQIAIEYARFDHGETVVGIDLDDAVHAFERNHDPAVDRHRRAGGVGAAAARDQRRARGAAGAHELHDLCVFDRKDDGVGLGLTA